MIITVAFVFHFYFCRVYSECGDKKGVEVLLEIIVIVCVHKHVLHISNKLIICLSIFYSVFDWSSNSDLLSEGQN